MKIDFCWKVLKCRKMYVNDSFIILKGKKMFCEEKSYILCSMLFLCPWDEFPSICGELTGWVGGGAITVPVGVHQVHSVGPTVSVCVVAVVNLTFHGCFCPRIYKNINLNFFCIFKYFINFSQYIIKWWTFFAKVSLALRLLCNKFL